MLLVLSLVAVLFTCFVLNHLIKNKRRWNTLSKIPCRQPLPILGNIPDFLRFKMGPGNVHSFSRLYLYLHGMSVLFRKEGMFLIWAGPTPLLCLFNPETVEPIFNNNKGQDTSLLIKYTEPWVGNGALTSKGVEWQKQRKLLNHSFNVRVLDNFIPVMNEQASILVQKLLKASFTTDFIDTLELYLKCTLDIICETALDTKINAQGTDSTYARMVQEAFDGILGRLSRPWYFFDVLFNWSQQGRRFKSAVDYIHDFSEKVIAEKMSRRSEEKLNESSDQKFESSPKRRLALLDLLIESGLSMREIRDQVDTITVGGFETVATTLYWISYMLGLHHNLQEKLAEEVDCMFAGDRERHVNGEDLKNLKYMEMVIKESLRMYPTFPIIAKKLPNDTEIGGHVIPESTECLICPYSVHRHPDHFPNPDVFDPERFAPENSVGRHSCAFIPFSSGLRNCLGQRYAMMELKIIMSHILRRYRITSMDPSDKVLVVPTGALKAVENIRMKFIPREY